jgi:hypothetical protein
MIGLFYLVFFFVLWVGFPYLFWRLWRSACKKTEGRWNLIITPVFALVALVWLATAFWYFGGGEYYYNAEVDRLCAIDGGVKVYETVKLPPEKFNKWGNVNFFRPTQGGNALGLEYIFTSQRDHSRIGEATITRSHYKVFRRADGKLLGETTLYIRNGGGFPILPFSSYFCPPTFKSSEQALFNRIFVKSE